MPQHVRETTDTQSADGIDEQGVAAVEGVNVAETITEAGPTGGLHCAADLQGELVEVQLPLVGWYAAFEHQPPQITVGGDIVEAVIVYPGVRQMFCHVLNNVPFGQVEEIAVIGEFKAQQSIAVLEPSSPLRPAACRVAAGNGDDGRSIRGLPPPVQTQRFCRGQLQGALDSGQ